MVACSTPEAAWTFSGSFMERSGLIQGDEKATIDCGSTNTLVTSGRKSYPPFKPALRYFQPVDDGRPEGGRKDASSRHQKILIFDNRFNVIRVHARQRDQDQYLGIGFENIGRRFP
jgi:hypothetical protein